MFIFNQIAKHNWKWHIWVCLLGYSEAATTWVVYCLSQTESASEAVEHVWLVRPHTRTFSLPPPPTHRQPLHACIQSGAPARRPPGLSVPDSIRFLPCPPFMPISCPPIKNAPRWLVKGRWEWRLGLFKDLLSIIQSQVWFRKWRGINKSCTSFFFLLFEGGSATKM